MKVIYKTLALGLVALGLQSSSAMAAPSSEYALLFPVPAQHTTTQTRINSGLRISTAHTDATGAMQPAQVTFVNMLDVPSSAVDVDVLITYTDRSGAVHVVRPSFLDDGCVTAAGTDGADVTCRIVEEAE